MAISFVAANSINSATGTTSVALPKPVGTADGDVLIAIGSIGAAQTWTTPTGWTLIGTVGATTGTDSIACYKVASSEPSTWTFAWTGGSSASVVVVSAYRGCDQVTPINVNTQDSTTSQTSQAVTTPSATTTVGNCWMLYTRTTRDDTGTAANVACTATSNERIDDQFGTGSVAHGAVIYDNATPVSSGSQTGLSISCTTSTPTDNVRRTIGLAPGGTSAAAGSATATAVAYQPALNAKPTQGVATAVGQNPTVTVGWAAPAGVATAAASGKTPTLTETSAPTAGVATAAATGQGPSLTETSNARPTQATATAVGQGPTVATGAPGVTATATASGQTPTTTLAAQPVAGVASAVAVGQNLSGSIGARPGVAAATATAGAVLSFLGTPFYRTYRVPAERRTLGVPNNVRRYQQGAETRTIVIGWDDQ